MSKKFWPPAILFGAAVIIDLLVRAGQPNFGGPFGAAEIAVFGVCAFFFACAAADAANAIDLKGLKEFGSVGGDLDVTATARLPGLTATVHGHSKKTV